MSEPVQIICPLTDPPRTLGFRLRNPPIWPPLGGIVFGTLNPAIPLLAAVNFVVCRASENLCRLVDMGDE